AVSAIWVQRQSTVGLCKTCQWRCFAVDEDGKPRLISSQSTQRHRGSNSKSFNHKGNEGSRRGKKKALLTTEDRQKRRGERQEQREKKGKEKGALDCAF